jgi:hypothetical protein
LSGGKGSGKLDKAAHWPTWHDAAKRFKCSPINAKNKNLSNCLKSKQYVQGAVARQKYSLPRWALAPKWRLGMVRL